MTVVFGTLTFDAERRLLRRGAQEIKISPKAFSLLQVLLEGYPRALSRASLIEKLWPATVVSDSSLGNLISEIRAAIGDDARRPAWVRTVPRFGYAFSGPVRRLPRDSSPTASKAFAFSLILWGLREVPLVEGDNVIGRDPEMDVAISSPQLSRRHARIHIEEGVASLEDLESKNGTYVNQARVIGPRVLADGDQLRFGTLAAGFRRISLGDTTQTEKPVLKAGPFR
jgi:DNA-binding winged helix-turn-helix (wHTH) protein